MTEQTVDDIQDEELLRRAVRNARSKDRRNLPVERWVCVTHAFALGSTFAHQLCRRFGLDPDEKVKR